ncbi:MAG: hypothetical protein P1U67_09080 [Alcanivoracaceae bacterium]|nr:hypothetical protein [Alcanivoracaceae bacterium]
MNAEIFYESIESTLGPALSRLGFVRLKGRRPVWGSRGMNPEIFIEMRYGKYPWEPYSGGTFSVFIRENGKPDDSIESLFSQISDDDLKAAISITEECAIKLQNADLNVMSEDGEEVAMYEDWREKELSTLTASSLNKEISIVINPTLPFYDQGDAEKWGALVGRVATKLFQAKHG